jgi:hypothetical protein
MLPNPARALQRLARARTLRRAQERENDLTNRPVYNLDPLGKLNQTLDTDLYTALPHPAMAPTVTAADLLAEVTRRIDALHTAGSLDEGSYTVLDNFLESHKNTMLTAAEEHTRCQLNFLNKAAITEKRIAQETWDTLQNTQATLEDAETLRTAARAALTGAPARTRTTHNAPMPAPHTIPAPGTAQTHHTRPPQPPNPAPPTEEKETTGTGQDKPATPATGTGPRIAPNPAAPGNQASEQDAEEDAA